MRPIFSRLATRRVRTLLFALLTLAMLGEAVRPALANIRWYGPRTRYIPPRGPFTHGYIQRVSWICIVNKWIGFPMWVRHYYIHGGLPPVPMWVEITLSEFGRIYRRHFIMRPGQRVCHFLGIRPGLIGYITVREIIPLRPIMNDHTMTISQVMAQSNGSDNFEPLSAATADVLSPAGLTPLSERFAFVSAEGDEEAEQVTAYSSTPTSHGSVENWNSGVDPGFRRITNETTTATPNGFVNVEEIDEDENGSVDRRVTRAFSQTPTAMSLDVAERDAANTLLHRIHVDKVMSGEDITADTETDSNGDGIVDSREHETHVVSGPNSVITIQFDDNADGLTDRTETTNLTYNGMFNSNQTTEIRDGGGALLERRVSSMLPFGNGFVMTEQTDTNGDGIFDDTSRQTWSPTDPQADQESTLLEIDNGADGDFDQRLRVSGVRSLVGTTYSDDVQIDQNDDGSVDSSVRHTVQFVQGFPATRWTLIAAAGAAILGAGLLVLRRRRPDAARP